MSLDSDVADADSKLYVEFYKCDRGEYKDKDFCKIITPGDKTSVWDQPVRESDKQRFPKHWLFYQMQNTEGQAFGTPLMEWHKARPDDLNENQVAELHAMKFQSVEHLASMSDAQAQRVGLGATALRQKAKAYLSSKGGVDNTAELKAAQDQIATMQTQMAALIERMNAQPAEPKKRGPKPGFKKKARIDVQHDAATGHPGNQ